MGAARIIRRNMVRKSLKEQNKGSVKKDWIPYKEYWDVVKGIWKR